MTRRTFLGTAAAARFRPASKPHLLLLMMDQFRADCIGADGNAAIRTPNLDRIAREGVLFRRAYSSTPTCTPARAALLTGQSPWNHGMLGYSKVAEAYPIELPRVLNQAGYFTGVIGKCHYSPQRNLHGFHWGLLDESSREQSIDFRSDYRSWFYSEAPNLNPDATGLTFNDYRAKPYVLPERLHPTAWMGDSAVHFLAGYERPQPFFLKVSFARPHSPYDPPERFWKMYEGARLPEARVGKWAAKFAPESPGGPNIWHGDKGTAQVAESRRGYYGSISFIDEQVGRILAALEKRGWLDETLIVVTADHGDMSGDQHLWRKSYAYEASARIPMLLRGPGAGRGERRDEVVEIRDILPTLADAAGASIPGKVDGASMLRVQQGWRAWLDLEHDVCYDASNHWSALTDGKWKYIYHAQDGAEQLFHLAADPHELAESADAAELRRWRARMVEHLAVRGEQWVAGGGKLVPRPKSILRSPNYPAAKSRALASAAS